jgi:hypothetical protein
VTTSSPLAGQLVGAVYKPPELIVPLSALHFVTFGDVNCCVACNFSSTVVGDTTGSGPSTSVIVAVAEPPGPVAITVALPDAGIVAGALYDPVAEIQPVLNHHFVAPGELNCCVCPKWTITVEGEIC